MPERVGADTAISAILEVARGHELVLIGLGGRGASGKTTLARRVPGAQSVGTEAFWNGTRFELERLCDDVLEPLKRGVPAVFSAYDWAGRRPHPEPRRVVGEGIVIVEGVCALDASLRGLYDLRLWLDTPRDVCLERAVARDGEASRVEWETRWIPSEERYIARDNPAAAADLIVESP